MLQKNGLTLKDIQSINLNYNLTQSLLSEKVDAVTGMMRTFEVIQLQLAKHPARVFLPEENGVPTYSELIFVVNKSTVNDPRFPKFLKALKKGNDYLQLHAEEEWLLFAKKHPESNNELGHRAWKASLPYFAKNPASFNKKEWQQFIDFLMSNDIIKKTHPIDFYAIDITKE
jgi:putative hydroxymethylpyrimidine transport system substrate-binding protein